MHAYHSHRSIRRHDMNSVDVVQQYASAFNAHDIPAMVSTFGTGAVYLDPVVAKGVNPQGLAEYASGLIHSMPDLRFDTVTLAPVGRDMVLLEWIMRGTNTGRLPQGPAANRSIELPGVDDIKVKNGKISS